MKDNHLLFIASQPRSGSTLLQTLLSNNSDVATLSEPWLLFHYLGFLNPDLISASFNYNLATQGLNHFITLYNEKNGKKYNDRLGEFIGQLYKEIEPSSKYFLDKTPRYYEILPAINKIFPESKIIVLKRNPFAVLNSIIETWDKSSTSLLSPYSRDLLVAPFKIQEFLDSHKRENVYEVKYEDIVVNPIESIRSIYEWLQLDFNEGLLKYDKNKKLKGDLGDPIGVKKYKFPVTDSLNSWEIKMQDNYWKSFFIEYSNFLGEDFLFRYGKYSALEGDVTDQNFQFYLLSNGYKNNYKYSFKKRLLNKLKWIIDK